MKKKIFWVSILTFIHIILPALVYALAPTLLWEKSLSEKIRDIEFAKDTGDVIVTTGDEIFLYNPAGEIVFHWGPRVDREATSVSITSDGSKFAYTDAYKEDYMIAKSIQDSDSRVRYLNRNGNELWNKNWEGFVRLSPDGSKVVINHSSEGEGFDILNANGNILWSKGGDHWGDTTTEFSPEGNYVAVVGDAHSPMLLMKADTGDVLFTTTELNDYTARTISDNATYLTTDPYTDVVSPDKSHDGKIYTKDGGILLNGWGVVSEDGSKVLMLYNDKTSLLRLPDPTPLQNFSIIGSPEAERAYADISRDGSYAVLIGQKAGDTSSGLYVIDTVNNIVSNLNYSTVDVDVYITNDGKYVMVRNRNLKDIALYQVF